MASATSIVSVKTALVSLPLEEPFATPLGTIKAVACLLIEVVTEGGLEGFGHLIWYNPRNTTQIKSVRVLVDDLGQALMGKDGLRRAANHQLMRSLTSETLFEGISTMAIGAIDIALWDLSAKHAGMPVALLLGGHRDAVPVYESSRLMKDEVTDISKSVDLLRSEKYGAVKILAGSRPFKEEVARVEAIRRALGGEVRLMVDCARRLTPSAAVRFARAIRDYDIHWLEDPVPQVDIAGLRFVREHGGVPVSTGERISGFGELQAILAADAVDHFMLDLQRIGGPTAWLSLAPALENRKIPLSGHGSHEFQAHLLASQPNGHYAEYHSWWNALYTEPPLPAGGMLQIRPKPGFGLELDRKAIARYRVD